VSVPVRVLIVDDSADDSLLLAEELVDNNFDPIWLRVDTPEAMRTALHEQQWDVIIADYRMPHFSGPEALQVLKETGLDIPLILVSGTTPDETGVEMMRAGAQDFIIKHNLTRLAPAVTREIEEADQRAQRRRAEESARVSTENYRLMFENSPIAIFTFDQHGAISQVNPAFEELLGLSAGETVGHYLWEVFEQWANSEEFCKIVDRVFAGELIKNVEWEDQRKNGTTVYFLANVTPVYNEQGQITIALAMSMDITERKINEQRKMEAETHMREFYRRTIAAATEGKLIISETDEINRIAGPAVYEWRIEDLEDIETARECIEKSAREIGMDETRVYNFTGCAIEALANAYKHAGGGYVSIHKVSDSLMLVVKDSGRGIEALALPDVALTKGYSTATSLGMGYKVMIEFADRIYLATGPDGTTVAILMEINENSQKNNIALFRLSSW